MYEQKIVTVRGRHDGTYGIYGIYGTCRRRTCMALVTNDSKVIDGGVVLVGNVAPISEGVIVVNQTLRELARETRYLCTWYSFNLRCVKYTLKMMMHIKQTSAVTASLNLPDVTLTWCIRLVVTAVYACLSWWLHDVSPSRNEVVVSCGTGQSIVIDMEIIELHTDRSHCRQLSILLWIGK